MMILGLTGSIGMGKSTAAAMFAEEGVPTHSADDAVHALYSGRAAPKVEALFPGTVKDGVVDREALSARVLGDLKALKALEALIHPMVRKEEEDFLARNRAAGTPIVLLDIPLLFEARAAGGVDKVIVVSAPADIQRERVLARPGMSEAKLAAILSKQMPDAEKRRLADFVIDTSGEKDATRGQVRTILAELRSIEGNKEGTKT